MKYKYKVMKLPDNYLMSAPGGAITYSVDPLYQHINKQQVTVQIPQLDKIELQAPNTNNPNWTVST
jgi:hypothetical protein